MPKAAVLHIHFTCAVDPEWVNINFIELKI